MPTLTLKGMPEQVYRVLKDRAAANHRSLNSEVLIRLERSVGLKPVDVAEVLARADEVRAEIQAHLDSRGLAPLTDDEITAAKNEGRP